MAQVSEEGRCLVDETIKATAPCKRVQGCPGILRLTNLAESKYSDDTEGPEWHSLVPRHASEGIVQVQPNF